MKKQTATEPEAARPGPSVPAESSLYRSGKKLRPAPVFAAAVLILGCALFLALYLPVRAEKAVSAAAEHLSEPGVIEFHVISAGLHSARLSCTVFGKGKDNKQNIFSCNDIQLFYSPWHVASGRLRSISLSGASLTILADPDGVSIPAFSIFRRKFFRGVRSSVDDPDSAFEFSAGKVNFSITATLVTSGQSLFAGPCRGELRPDPADGWNFIRGHFTLPDGGKMSCGYDIRKNELECAGAFSFHPAPFLTEFRALPFSALPKEIFRSHMKQLRARVSVSKLALSLSEPSPWKRLQAGEFHFSLAASGGSPFLEQGYAVYDAVRSELKGSATLRPAENPPLPLHFLLKRGEKTHTFRLETLPAGENRERDFSINGISFQDPEFSLIVFREVNPAENQTGSGFQLELSCARLRTATTGAGEVFLTGKSSPDGGPPRFSCRLTNAALNGNSFFYYAPHVRVAYQHDAAEGKCFHTFESEKGSLEIPALQLKCNGISISSSNLPGAPPSRFQTGEIRMNGRILGSFSGRAVCTSCRGKCSPDLFVWPESVYMDGSAAFLGQKGRLALQADSRNGGTVSANLDFPRQKLISAGRPLLEFFLPAIDTAKVNGYASFRLTAATNRPSKACFTLDGARLQLPDDTLTAEGLALTLHLTALPGWETSPGQTFSFNSLSSGDLVLKQGRGTFRIDPDAPFRIESFRASWCGGDLSLADAVFPSAGKTVAICENLQFPCLLTQLGLGSFRGNGRVSGKLPFTLSDSGLSFYGGILYSLPGEKGILQGSLRKPVLAAAETAGKTYPGIAFAYETLRDMTYRWVRAGINTGKDGKERLSLHFNGTPAQPLPYALDLESNRIIRTQKPLKISENLLLNLTNLPCLFGNLDKMGTLFRR